MEKANFEFNKQSGASLEKMQPAARDQHHLMQKAQELEKQNHEADYERHKPQRIADAEKQLTQTNELNLNMPRPSWAPPPELLTADQIRKKARENVEKGHITASDEIAARHKITTDDHIKEALGHPVDKSEAVYQDRRAAFMKRRQEQRQREQKQDRSR